ncbi:MAG: hypothetical protein BJ554DRAFT_2332 [Olpidium bornovanus]|uniref:Uncharacterized protein n=1 Tax=Olpidium bornovanus TaxID=278681 RepID=A0A8H8A0R8_9FUNG|nr:MAG: hypothetical protein BJ554DRAFT_2332 [Olpidium bornovanus]
MWHYRNYGSGERRVYTRVARALPVPTSLRRRPVGREAFSFSLGQRGLANLSPPLHPSPLLSPLPHSFSLSHSHSRSRYGQGVSRHSSSRGGRSRVRGVPEAPPVPVH